MPKYEVDIHYPDVLHPSDPGVDTTVSITAESPRAAELAVTQFYGPSTTIKATREVGP